MNEAMQHADEELKQAKSSSKQASLKAREILFGKKEKKIIDQKPQQVPAQVKPVKNEQPPAQIPKPESAHAGYFEQLKPEPEEPYHQKRELENYYDEDKAEAIQVNEIRYREPQPLIVNQPRQDLSFLKNEPVYGEALNVSMSESEQLLEGLELSQGMPMCSERVLKDLIALVKNHERQNLPLSTKEVTNMMADLTQRLISESLMRAEVQVLLSEAERCLERRDLEGLLKQVVMLKKEVISLDIQRVKFLVDMSAKASKCIVDKEIVLFIGNSGVGKSTTIHFLAGSKMKMTMVNNISHVAPVEIMHEQAKQIKTGPFAFSVTKFINAVDIDDYDVTLTDTPGFEDDQGAEVDIANGVGVVTNIRKSKKIIPVIVVSEPSLGERFIGLKKLLRLLLGMFNDIDKVKSSFTYVFTKFGEQTRRDFANKISHFLDNMSNDERSDEGFVKLVRDLKTKATNDKIIYLDPLRDERIDLLEKITQTRSKINSPSDDIRQYFSEASKEKMKNQIAHHLRMIQDATLQGNNPALVYYKISELRTLVDIFDNKEEESKKGYEDACLKVVEFLKRKEESLNKTLNRNLALGNMINKAEIEAFNTGIKELEQYELLKRDHLANVANEIPDHYILRDHLNKKIIELLKQIDSTELHD